LGPPRSGSGFVNLCTDPDPSINKQTKLRKPSTSQKINETINKQNIKKTFYLNYFDFLSSKTDVNVLTVSTVISKKLEINYFFVSILRSTYEKSRIQ
jgi:hypothetical protein